MKSTVRFFFCLLASVLILGAGRAVAQTFAQDHAANFPYTNGWQSADNGGFGFNPWSLADNNNGSNAFSGFFVGDAGSALINVSNKSFGIYANGEGVNYAVAYRAFTNALTVGRVFTLKFKNTAIASGGVMGFSFRTGTNFTGANDFATLTSDARFAFYFVGGSSSYTIRDANIITDTGIPFSFDGFTLEFSLRDANTYRFVVKNAAGTATIATFDNQPLQGSGPIDSFALFNLDTGGSENAFFNQISLVSVSLVPPEILAVLPANGSFYLPASQQITFNTASAFSTISTNNIKVQLNGFSVTSLVFSGSDTNWSVTASPVLTSNVVYDAIITVTDGNGNSSTNNFTFNTWSADNLFIEAEAYNFSSGAFIASPAPGQYDTLTAVPATAGIDFFERIDGGTNEYRTNDIVDLELSGDAADHAHYQDFGLVNWALSYVQSGEWLNFTRRIPTNSGYNVYARYSGGFQPVILMERTASPTATTTNQPRAALGTFVGTDTGNIVSNYNFTPLKDFFGNLVTVRLTQLTNTFRLTRTADSYNLDYLTFIPITDTNLQRPYISAGFPFPGAAGVLPDQAISFTIANRQTTNVVSSVKLIVNGADVSGSLAFTTHAAGTIVSYQPLALFPLDTNITVRAVFSDNAGVAQTNDWTFTTATVLTIPADFALTSGSGLSNGFSVRIVKAPNTAPPGDFPPTSIRAENHLAGLITNTETGLVWTNEAGGPNNNGLYAETNVVNYEQCGHVSDDGDTFPTNAPFPYVSLAPFTPCVNTNSPDFISMSFVTYVQLTAGLHQWAVRSDDGFRLTVGTGSNPTNLLIMDFEGGRSSANPSVFNFIVPMTGVYPMRLLYYEGGFGGSLEWYSIDRITGEPILINDPANANSIKVYRASSAAGSPVVILDPQHIGNSTTFNFLTQAGKTHTVQYKVTLTDALWQTLRVIAGSGSATNITDTAATNGTRYYRVATQ